MTRFAVLLVLLSGCALFSNEGTGDDDDVIDGGTGCADGGRGTELRDPETLNCTGGGCREPSADQAPLPPWGVCGSSCEALGELECMTTTACRVVYDYDCVTGEAPCASFTPFMGCFPISDFGLPPDRCEGLDSWNCSGHDDCVALHRNVCDGEVCWRQFMECRSENR